MRTSTSFRTNGEKMAVTATTAYISPSLPSSAEIIPLRKEYPSAALNWAAIPKRKASETNMERSSVMVVLPGQRRLAPSTLLEAQSVMSFLRIALLDALSFPRGVDLPQPLGSLVLEHDAGIPLGPERREPHQDWYRVFPLLRNRPADEVRPLSFLDSRDHALPLQ